MGLILGLIYPIISDLDSINLNTNLLKGSQHTIKTKRHIIDLSITKEINTSSVSEFLYRSQGRIFVIMVEAILIKRSINLNMSTTKLVPPREGKMIFTF